VLNGGLCYHEEYCGTTVIIQSTKSVLIVDKRLENPGGRKKRKWTRKVTEKRISELSLSQRSALPHFMVSRPITECCKAADIPVKTYYEWNRLYPAWRKALEAFHMELIEEGKNNLYRQITTATEVLCEKMRSNDESIQMKAIEAVLTHTSKYFTQDAIIKEIQAVKAAIGTTPNINGSATRPEEAPTNSPSQQPPIDSTPL
jgi:hypothetical protein